MKPQLFKSLLIVITLIGGISFRAVQGQSDYTIAEVKFKGLEKTEPQYLKRFIKTEADNKLDSSLLEEDVQYLSNVPFILNATYKIAFSDDQSPKAHVTFNCMEQHTLLPIINFGGLPNNFWFRVGASEANLLGKGIKLSGFYQYYDRSSYQVHLGYPFMGGSQWGANVRFTKWSTVEPLYFSGGNSMQQKVTYKYDNYNMELTGRYKFSTGTRPLSDEVTFGGVLFRELYQKTSDNKPSTLGPEEVDKNKFLAKVIYQKDHLDYDYFYLDGWHNSLHLQTVFTEGSNERFHVFFNDLKYFNRMGKQGNWANRLRVGLSMNRETPFAPFVLDNSVNIRGVGNKIDRGTGTIVYNSEYRQTLYENDFGAIQSVGFTDLGTWRQPGGNFQDFVERENFRFYGGGGIRLIYKPVYDAILRVDYSVNLLEPSKRGFVIGLGQYF